ncbi:MAG TPA: M48 family peptidase, partial [Nitrospira sp.]|nr:M48 family peptidase [Nitrospira sp.]
MYPSDRHSIETLLNTSIGRRAALALGARAASLLATTMGFGAALGLLQSVGGCQRAPGTARDQFIYLSEEKEMAMG